MRNVSKFTYKFFLLIALVFSMQSCTDYNPAADNAPQQPYSQNQQLVPYNTWIDQLKETDQKRYQEYVLLRRHIDSNHAVTMYRIHTLQDSVMVKQRANNNQIISLRKEVHRLTNVVYFMLAITVLCIAYVLFEQGRKRKQNRIMQEISYTPVEEQEAVPAVIMPTNDEDEQEKKP